MDNLIKHKNDNFEEKDRLDNSGINVIDKLYSDFEKTKEEDLKILKEVNENLRNNVIKLKNRAEKIKKYSTFNIHVIGPVLADLIGVYTCVKTVFESKGTNKFVFYGRYCPFEISDYKEVIISFHEILINPKSDFEYEFISKHSRILDKYPFLIGFIDSVIEYRIANDVVEITSKELIQLEQEYVLEHLDEINEIHAAKNQEDEEKLRKEFLEKKQYRKNLIVNLLKKDDQS